MQQIPAALQFPCCHARFKAYCVLFIYAICNFFISAILLTVLRLYLKLPLHPKPGRLSNNKRWPRLSYYGLSELLDGLPLLIYPPHNYCPFCWLCSCCHDWIAVPCHPGHCRPKNIFTMVHPSSCVQLDLVFSLIWPKIWPCTHSCHCHSNIFCLCLFLKKLAYF